jgi:hypothetical protein
MERLHRQVHESVNLSVRQGDEIVCIERVLGGGSMMRIVYLVGVRAPPHITAVGKVFLTEGSPEAVRDCARRTGLPARTRNTFTALPELLHELERVRRHRYAYDNEETELGVRCVGAGIHDDGGRLVARLSVSAPATRLERGWAVLVKETAQDISPAPSAGDRHATPPDLRAKTSKPSTPGKRARAQPIGERKPAPSIHLRMRLASPRREFLPTESSSTMMTRRLAMVAFITRQRPASLM